jgi:hypothetical protein
MVRIESDARRTFDDGAANRDAPWSNRVDARRRASERCRSCPAPWTDGAFAHLGAGARRAGDEEGGNFR